MQHKKKTLSRIGHRTALEAFCGIIMCRDITYEKGVHAQADEEQQEVGQGRAGQGKRKHEAIEKFLFDIFLQFRLRVIKKKEPAMQDRERETFTERMDLDHVSSPPSSISHSHLLFQDFPRSTHRLCRQRGRGGVME